MYLVRLPMIQALAYPTEANPLTKTGTKERDSGYPIETGMDGKETPAMHFEEVQTHFDSQPVLRTVLCPVLCPILCLPRPVLGSVLRRSLVKCRSCLLHPGPMNGIVASVSVFPYKSTISHTNPVRAWQTLQFRSWEGPVWCECWSQRS